MNLGDCPYEDCDGFLSFELPERTPVYAIVECETCNRSLWYKFSRVDPIAWTIEDFEAEHIVDVETHSIVKRV